MWFSVSGIPVVPQAGLRFETRYTPVDAVSQVRMAGGGLAQQVAWRKLRVEIAGQGTYPPALDALDYNQPMELLCPAPIARASAGPSIVLPAARRTDAAFVPQGFAAVAQAGTDPILDPRLVPTPAVMTGDTADLTPVPGATLYVVHYWPRLTVIATRPEYDHPVQPAGGRISWSLAADEV